MTRSRCLLGGYGGLSFAVLLLLTGCTSQESMSPGEQGQKLRITTSTNIMTDLVKQVGGEDVQVTGLMETGIDPHTYQAKLSDLEKLENCDLIIGSGLKLEPKKMDAAFAASAAMSNGKKTYLRVGDVLAKQPLTASQIRSTEGGTPDPHFWNHIGLYRAGVEVVTEALCAKEPGKCSRYQQRRDHYQAQLGALEGWVQRSLQSIPATQRSLITSHDAFSYLEAYGLTTVSLKGTNTAAELSTHDVNRVVRYMLDHKIPVVFAETSISEDGMMAVFQGVERQRKQKVLRGDPLFADSLDAPDRPAGTYLGMITQNIRSIVKGLQGESYAQEPIR